jgi:hypothetical protein
VKDYNSYKGNAYGLANILTQTAFLRPKIISKKVENLFFTGQLTVPGPGVPPSIISGKIVSDLIRNKCLGKNSSILKSENKNDNSKNEVPSNYSSLRNGVAHFV